MPRKAFLADLKAAQALSLTNITAVEAGPTSGTFSFLYLSHHLPESSVIIQAEVPEVSDYPTEHDCFLFINPDQNPPPSIPTTLVSISSQVKGKTLLETLSKVATALDKVLDPTEPIEVSDYEEALEGGDSDFDFDDDDDEIYSGKPRTMAINDSRTARKFPGDVIPAKRIRSDLRAAKRAGFKVGISGNLNDTGIVCISVRVTKLGISEEAMKAWGLRRKQYLILMIRFLDGYQTIEQVQNESTLSGRTQIRAGLCERYKPTFEDATNMFTHVSASATSNDLAAQGQQPKYPQLDTKEPAASLEPLFIGSAINDLFRERFAAILKYRLACAYPWSGAETFFDEVQGKNISDVSHGDPRYYVPEDMKGRTLPQIVTADTIAEPKDGLPLSLPLAAMQFLLRHFVRCTEFCLVCHCRVDGTFEALKPYVCSKPLCLYQYMSLGFGPSIGWEIITQPYVVDVLVSFCYISARSGKLKDFPTGIAMKVPMPPQVRTQIADQYAYRSVSPVDSTVSQPDLKYERSFSARLSREKSELLVDTWQTHIRTGDWLVVQGSAITNGSIHYRVADSSLFPTVKLDSEGIFVRSIKAQPYATDASATAASKAVIETRAGYFDVDVFLYNQAFDILPNHQKQNCVVMLLDTLPPILTLREHLLSSHQGPDPQLRTRRHDLSESALNLLRWIIASNRSCIMQVDKLADKHAGGTPSKVFTGMEENRVSGMDDYMQFRFAQGAPDKEQRFINCVNEVAARTKSSHPTLFAWHGSPIANWHSIVREGLHFKDTLHGRAFGNGIYMSNSVGTSLSYSSMGSYGTQGVSSWPNSELKISTAISLNEVVNCPGEYVSSTPHYVVAQLDWVQTRYLFVKTSTSCHTKTPPPPVSYQQDPARRAIGAGNTAVVIPITAVSKSRRPVFDTKTLPNGTKKAKVIGGMTQQTAEDAQDDADSVVSDLADREYLDSDMENNSPIVLKEVSNGRVKRPRDLTESASSEVADMSLTDFIPGTLDLATFKMLKEPAYATPQGTKRLAKTLQELVKVQTNTRLQELGWYIDANKIENLYQWIIELHSFDKNLPLAIDMKKAGLTSVVLEMRFTANFPFSPPFVRVVRPRFLPFLAGGGGHVTAGGAICMELLTNNGWLVTNSIESVLLQIRMAISSTEPKPARLECGGGRYGSAGASYGVGEAIEAYKRACRTHGWEIPKDIDALQRD